MLWLLVPAHAGWTRQVVCDPLGDATALGVVVYPEGASSQRYFVCEARDPGTQRIDLLYDTGAGLAAPVLLSDALEDTPHASYGYTFVAGADGIWLVAGTVGQAPCTSEQSDAEYLHLDRATGAILERGALHADQSDCAAEGRAALALDEAAGRLYVTYTREDTSVSGEQENLWSNARDLSTGIWGEPVQLVGGRGVQNHSVVSVDPARSSACALLYHDDTEPGGIVLRLEDAYQARVPALALDDDGSSGNFPFLATVGGEVHVVWAERGRIWYRACLGTAAPGWEDCDALSEWEPISPATKASAVYDYAHPQLAVDAWGDVFVVYEREDQDTGERRVRLTTTCGPGRTLQGPTYRLVDNTLGNEEIGRGPVMSIPALVVDEVQQTLVLSYVRDPGDGDAVQGVVASRPISELCR